LWVGLLSPSRSTAAAWISPKYASVYEEDLGHAGFIPGLPQCLTHCSGNSNTYLQSPPGSCGGTHRPERRVEAILRRAQLKCPMTRPVARLRRRSSFDQRLSTLLPTISARSRRAGVAAQKTRFLTLKALSLADDHGEEFLLETQRS
jgi:hypothetical protein